MCVSHPTLIARLFFFDTSSSILQMRKSGSRVGQRLSHSPAAVGVQSRVEVVLSLQSAAVNFAGSILQAFGV